MSTLDGVRSLVSGFGTATVDDLVARGPSSIVYPKFSLSDFQHAVITALVDEIERVQAIAEAPRSRYAGWGDR